LLNGLARFRSLLPGTPSIDLPKRCWEALVARALLREPGGRRVFCPEGRPAGRMRTLRKSAESLN
jgi:hypothetical protein